MAEILLTSLKFSVERRTYNVPGRGSVQREVVIHPGAVLILPLLDDRTVVMIRNVRQAIGRELLELPAGTLEPPEPPDACAARELEEETGYVAGRLEPLCGFFTTPGFTTEYLHAFVATGLRHKAQRLEETEQIRVEAMNLEDALAATLDGRIVDAKTIAALHVYHYAKQRAV